ncbi:MAG: phosphoribosylformylglycinamidine synthase subunit PurQ [Planctomycetes bacterium]|nr:phosphoribosylformylglycinamidine synthase subunit PurQ [Planctomycetota bacterium]
MRPCKALVITAPGINCDLELSQAFAAAGAQPESVLLSRLMRQPSLVDDYALIGLPGGFSYGDDVAAGRIMAVLMRREMYPALSAAVARGVPMICPCNGFQIAVQAGLLPGPQGNRWPTRSAVPTVALATNIGERFNDAWTHVEIPANTRCVWTRGLAPRADCDLLPSAHGEGRFMTDPATLESLEKNGQVALRYAASENFNGSLNAIAGICDPSGLVLGLMPHPERFTRWTQHPWWTRLSAEVRSGDTLGLSIFKNAVAHVDRNEPHVAAVGHHPPLHHNSR